MRSATRTVTQTEDEENQEPFYGDEEDDKLRQDIYIVSSESQSGIPVCKKPPQGKKKKLEWTDKEVESLIQLWSQYE